MKKISLSEFAAIIQSDEALRAQVEACSDRDSAGELLSRMAGELGYELKEETVSGKQAVEDDDLGEIAGGRNLLSGYNSGVLYPYSWFVTILKLLRGEENSERSPEPSSTPEAFRR